MTVIDDGGKSAAAGELDFTREQLDYLDAPLDRHVYLKAYPGSGKTEVVAAMVSKVVGEWSLFPAGIAVLTFSNSATDELKGRVHKHLREPIGYPHSISTFDSFVFTRLVGKIAHDLTGYKGKDGDYRIRVLEKSAKIIPTRTPICGRRIDTKRKLWEAGFATYGDIDMLALMALREAKYDAYFTRLARRFPLVIVDECQDLSEEQLRIVEKLHDRGVKFHFVGDLNQSIYGFRRSNPERVEKLMDRLDFKLYELTANWRSGQAIVDLCSNLLGIGRIKGNPKIASVLPQILEYQQCPSELLPTIRDLTRQYQRVVLVARGHTTLQRLRSGDAFEGIEVLAVAFISASTGSLKDIKESLRAFAKWLTGKLEMQVSRAGPYCPVAMESKLAWRQFIYESLKFMAANGAADPALTWSAWARNAKLALRQLPDQAFVPAEIRVDLEGLRELNISARAGEGQNQVSVRLLSHDRQEYRPDSLRYETIHQVKGETHDVTVLVSSQQPGVHLSHWRDWLRDRSTEAARFANVASSRPQHRLFWAVKKLKPKEREVLAQLGFEIP